VVVQLAEQELLAGRGRANRQASRSDTALARVYSRVMLLGRSLFASVLALCVGCSSSADVSTDEPAPFCQLTVEIQQISDAANEQPLTSEAAQLSSEKIFALQPLIPDGYVDDYRLRYWPTTNVSGLDTSGVSAQAAYDRMRLLFEQTCGSR